MDNSKENPIKRALIFQEGSLWVIQCMEFNVAASGNSLREAIEALSYRVSAYYAMAEEFDTALYAGLGEAPPRYWGMCETAEKAGKVLPIPLTIRRFPDGPGDASNATMDLELVMA